MILNLKTGLRILITAVTLFLTGALYLVEAEDDSGEESTDVLNELSLGDLLSMNISTGSFLDLDISKSPLSMTIITDEMIQTSGARNMSELLEIYVPGFIYNINKWNGTLWGMRGVINDRNTKILYLVNGHKMNTQARDGFQCETVLGMLGDIERVEVLRGPAGLVYGSGAIAGIINVVTNRQAGTSSDVSINMDADRSKSIEANVHGAISENQQISITAGYRKSEGMPTGNVRIYGRSGWPGNLEGLAGTPTDGNLGSTDGNWKIAGNWKFKNLNLYARATRQKENGGAWFVADPWPEIMGADSTSPVRTVEPGLKATYETWKDATMGNMESFRNALRTYKSDNFMMEGSFEQPIGENNLNFKLGFDRNSTTMEYEKRDRYYSDFEYVNWLPETFGESRYSASAMFLLKSVTNLQLAVGMEYRLDHCGDDMQGRNYESGNLKQLVISDVYYNTYSLFTEGFYDITDWFGVHAGGRLDFHTRAFMANPKLALVYKPSDDNSIKLIYQSSSNNGSVDNYEYNRYHYDANGLRHYAPWIAEPRREPTEKTEVVQPAPSPETLHALKPEKVHSIELAYVGTVFENLSLQPSFSWGIVKDLFVWSQDLFTVLNIGDYQYLNLDLDAKYTGRIFQFGVNHTFQRPFRTDPEKYSKSKVMYRLQQNEDSTWGRKDSVDERGDSLWTVKFRENVETTNLLKQTITYDGDDFLNLPTNMTKLYLTVTPSYWISISTSLRLFWGIPGRKPVLSDPVAGDNGAVYNYFGYYGEKESQGFKDYIMHGVSKKWNAGINLFIPGDFIVSLYAYNILGIDRHTGDPSKDTYAVNTLRLAQMFSLYDRNLYSMDQQSLGFTITKKF